MLLIAALLAVHVVAIVTQSSGESLDPRPADGASRASPGSSSGGEKLQSPEDAAAVSPSLTGPGGSCAGVLFVYFLDSCRSAPPSVKAMHRCDVGRGGGGLVRFALSRDGLHFDDLNGGEPIPALMPPNDNSSSSKYQWDPERSMLRSTAPHCSLTSILLHSARPLCAVGARRGVPHGGHGRCDGGPQPGHSLLGVDEFG